MPAQIPDTGLPVGTVLTYNAAIDQSLWSLVKTGIGSADGLFQAIRSTLWMKWDLQVVKTDYGSLATTIFGGPTPITIKVQMSGPKTYAQPDDIRSIVDGEIADALGGSYLTSSNVSDWTIPKSAGGTGETVDTGAPGADTSIADQLTKNTGVDPSAIAKSISDALADALKKATSGFGVGTGIVVIVLGLAIVAGVLIYFSPAAPARAYREFRRASR